MKASNLTDSLPRAEAPYDRWQVGMRPISMVIQEGPAGPWSPLLLLVVEAGTGFVLGHRLVEHRVDPNSIAEFVSTTMHEPVNGTPRKPATIQTDIKEFVPALRKLAGQIGATVELLPELPELSFAVHSFEEFLQNGVIDYSDIGDATPDQIGSFFQAAADFRRAEPWKRITDTEPLTLLSEEFTQASYAVIMGNGRIVRGLAIYDDAEDLDTLYTEDDVNPSELACTAMMYVERKEMDEAQWRIIKENGWPVVSSRSIPLPTRTDPFSPPGMPNVEQLRQLQIAMAVLPDFVARLPRRYENRPYIEPAMYEVDIEPKPIRIWVAYGVVILKGQPGPEVDLDAEE